MSFSTNKLSIFCYILCCISELESASSQKISLQLKKHELRSIPEFFDARQEWPYCESIRTIKSQYKCGACWAFAATSVMNDRFCIADEGKILFEFSVEDLIQCCDGCVRLSSNGCAGGSHVEAFLYLGKFGIVSGGEFNSSKGCKPISDKTRFYNQKFRDVSPCQKKCSNTNYNVSYVKDKRKGGNVYTLEDVEQIQIDIMTNGPVAAYMRVYDNFKYYETGVYNRTININSNVTYLHSVKILGWGLENGEAYWLVANSWGVDWGENGFFKILRGVNFCLIEEAVVAALAHPKSCSYSYHFLSNHHFVIFIICINLIRIELCKWQLKI